MEKKTFHKDLWDRPEGGGGLSRVLQEGGVIEKGGVNFSAVHGQLPDNILHALKVNDPNFFATGVSIVIHPHNPWVPIIHMNIRYFELEDGTYWFGGGIDLTPHYVNQEQASFFHTQLKNTCDAFHPEFYTKYKQWADDYFYIKHRQETRGIGGIFFDRLNENSSQLNKTQIFDFVCAVGRTFAPTYVHLMNLNKNKTFTPEHKQWQHLRRGRYVEFNLVYDKGTKFGLDTNGRIESILMSLPKTAQWFYDYKPETHSEEQKTLDALKKGIDWI
jgi:coproporphyrinogen III oxidase